MLIEITIGVVVAAALLKLLVNPQPRSFEYGPDDIDCVYQGGEHHFDPPLARVSYGTGPGARVFGWPAKGGVYILVVSAVEIEFLGYDRFEPVPRPDPTDPNTAADEEAHCNKLRQLGANWWESELAWADHPSEVGTRPLGQRFLATGWPAGGGVWVFSEYKELAGGKHAGMLFNAYTMEERCKIIEQLGGTFYASPRDCPELDLA